MAELTDIEKLRQNAYDNNPSNVGYVTQIVSGLDLQTDDEIRYVKVVSQDGSLQKMYKLVIKGTDEAPSVESVTVNGLDALHRLIQNQDIHILKYFRTQVKY